MGQGRGKNVGSCGRRHKNMGVGQGKMTGTIGPKTDWGKKGQRGGDASGSYPDEQISINREKLKKRKGEVPSEPIFFMLGKLRESPSGQGKEKMKGGKKKKFGGWIQKQYFEWLSEVKRVKARGTTTVGGGTGRGKLKWGKQKE